VVVVLSDDEMDDDDEGEKKGDEAVDDEKDEDDGDPFEGVSYPPLTLPFTDPKKTRKRRRNMGNVVGEEDEEEIERPKSPIIATSSRYVNSQDIYFIQLPSVLPLIALDSEEEDEDDDEEEDEDAMDVVKSEGEDGSRKKRRRKPKKKKKKKQARRRKRAIGEIVHEKSYWEKEFTNSLLNCREGRIGTLVMHQSGRTVLRIGPHDYELGTPDARRVTELEVSKGATMGMCEDVVKMDPRNKTCCLLGTVKGRLVATPNIDAWLQQRLNANQD